jgi:hypothetical protein
MIRKFLLGLLICLMTVAFTGEAFAKTEASAKAKLDTFVTEYVKKANKRMSVNRKKPQVEKRGTVYVARFTEIDEKTAFAEMRKSKSKHFQYVARLRYHEMTYESEGKTRKAALKGPWKCVNVRRLTEMPRYAKGKWEN